MGSAGRAFDAVVFDLDGVLVDTERVVHEVWREIFSRHGCAFTPEEWSSTLGTDRGSFDPLEALAARCRGTPPEPAALRAMVDRQIGASVRGLPPLPGVRAWISGARDLGLALAVASSSPRCWVEAQIAGAGLSACFTAVSCRGPGLSAKPAPDLYRDACGRLGVDPARAVAVEDSPHGITAARAAGLGCVAIRSPLTRAEDLGHADLVIDSLAEVGVAAALHRLALR